MPIIRKINKAFFKAWSSNTAYILGFMFADGNIIKNKRGGHFFAIYTADLDLLGQMRKCMKSEHKISQRMGVSRFGYSIQVGSKEMFEDLCRLGLTPNKSKRMKLPKVPLEYFSDFVRGYFDGDGNIWSGHYNKKRVTPTKALSAGFTSASLEFLADLQRSLRRRGIKGGYTFISQSRTYGQLRFSTLDALKLAEIMYNVPHRLFLQRKRTVFEKFKQMRL